ncbi:MAG: hypothetical protein KDC98_18630 [Planctomycetes bacterium]|nr:hypothetical protein [Planctomycetota bacterium]
MAGSTLKPSSSKELTRLFALLANSAGETLASLVNRQVSVRPAEAQILDNTGLIADLRSPYVVAHGGLDKDYADKSMAVMFELQDAVAMAGMLMMTPEEVIEQRRRAGVMEGEDAEAFGELGNVLFSGIGTTLRENVANVDVRLQKHGVVKPGVDVDGMLDEGVLTALTFTMQVGDYPETTGYMVIDLATAEAWNKGALETMADAAGAAGGDEAEKPAQPQRGEDPAFEAIPAAPIRGTLAAFVTQPEVLRTLRYSCRRVGLDLRRHGKGEIPNPAAHRQEIVLVDVPPGDDRHFDWCKRIKDFSPDNKVVLLLHHPSRNRVTQAFLSKADVILGFPCDELQLSQKLTAILDAAPVTPGE